MPAHLCNFHAFHLFTSCHFKKGRGEEIKYNEMNNKMSSLLFVFLIDSKYF